MTTRTPSPAAYSDSDRDYAEALEAARQSPALYALLAHGLRPARHHRVWYDALRETVTTPGGRLLLIAPPGTAKSSLVSFVLPLWFLGNHPDRSVLATTSSDAMAGEFGGVLELALRTNPVHRAVFPEPDARPDVRRGWSQDGYFLRGVPPGVKDPSLRFAGFGASVIGARAHLLLLDDPLTQDAATSEAEMRRARRFTDLTLLTRLHPQGSAIAIMTRFGEDDLAAHLMAQGWRTVVAPQLSADYPGGPDQRDAEGRAPLWPERYDLAWVQQERQRLGTAAFELIHQGNPLLMGGDVYRAAEWFRPLPDTFLSVIAPHATRVTFIDTAFSSRETSDWTVATTLAYDPRDPQRRVYLTNLFRKRIGEDGLAAALAAHLLHARPAVVGVEVPAFRQEAVGGLILQLRQHLLGRLAVDIQGIPVATDKVTRARLPAARAEAGLLFVDRGLPDWPVMERELLAFPVAVHDDCSDSLAGACVMALGPAGQRALQRPTQVRFG